MAHASNGERVITGRMVLFGLIAFFGVVFAVNGTMLALALKTNTGMVANEPYRKGLKYNERIAAEERQQALGWKSEITVDAKAKRIVAGRLTIFGNLELKHLETYSRDEVVALTRRTLAEGMPGGRFALQPTAEPITIPLGPKLEENWMAYIDTALEHGRYA